MTMPRKTMNFDDCIEIAVQMRVAYLAWAECARLAQKNLKTTSREYKSIMRAGESLHAAIDKYRIEMYNSFENASSINSSLAGLDSLRGY
jgi:hypothetical protein